MVSFTGSAKVGWTLRAMAGTKRVALELGGNGGLIVDDGADLEYAATRTARGAFVHAGQVCLSVQRIFVHRNVYFAFLKHLVDATERLLRLRHHLTATAPDDFSVRNIADIQQVRLATSQTQALLLAGIAVVSLVVGGIGIMNIMLVSVTERTREIGLRMAVGARGRDILLQFLVEALTLACLGGLIGIAMGLATAETTSALAHWPVLVSGFSIVLGFVSSLVVGVVFGFYPAERAAALDPIVALRYE